MAGATSSRTGSEFESPAMTQTASADSTTLVLDEDELGAAVTASGRSALPLVPPAEIDVHSLIRDFRQIRRAPLDEDLDFSREFTVLRLPPSERPALQIDPCPVCGNVLSRARYSIEGTRYRIVDCTACGLGRLHPMPDGDAIGRFYPVCYYGRAGSKFVPAIEAFVRLVGARHVRALSRGLPEKARVLDVGCGRGVLLSSLADRGFEAHGFEVSPAAAAGADRRAFIRIASCLEEAGYPDAHFDEVILWHVLEHLPDPKGTVAVVTAGTSDLPVAREAVVTAQVFGAATTLIQDVGVAGLHRLLAETETLAAMDAIIAIAGTDGAMPGVVAGLVGVPVIAVPTSVGYGTSLGGLAALLTMLNACAPGLTVVNIDNGFSAAVAAARIARRVGALR